MKLADQRLFLDQSLHRSLGPWLHARGFDVVAARDAGMSTSADDSILAWAVEQRRVLVTHDIGFGRRVLRSTPRNAGVLILRQANRGLHRTVAQLEFVLAQDIPAEFPFLVVVQTRETGDVWLRVRNL